jgi:putative nucleotidyltransferase with HDIG domain
MKTPQAVAPNPKQRAFAFLKLLAEDLSKGQITFPTFVDATMKIRGALNDPEINTGKLSRLISSEPLLSAKLLRAANSVALNPGSKPVGDIKTAVLRVGQETVKTLAVSIAMEQLQGSQELAPARKLTEDVWRHSLMVAAMAYVIAQKLTKLSPDEALFAGLVHDIGKFYLISRAAKHPELFDDPVEFDTILMDWHASMGVAVLESMAMPAAVLKAVNDHETGEQTMSPRTLADVVVLANCAANALEMVASGKTGQPIDPVLGQLLQENESEIRSLLAALRN